MSNITGNVVMLPFLLILVMSMTWLQYSNTALATSGTNVITVSFNSIKVHKNHEGGTWGDGEYNLFAFVQGEKVDLTRASGPGDGLWDVSNGEELTFNQAYVTTELPNNVPLVIFTIGHEVDRCGRQSFEVVHARIQVMFSNPQLVPSWSSDISHYQRHFGDLETSCYPFIPYGYNDPLGKIKEFYDPPNYGAGRHVVKSSSGDFTLRYTISGPDTCGQNIC